MGIALRAQAPLVFVLGSGLLLWATGTLHLGAPEPGAEAAGEVHGPGDGHDHGPTGSGAEAGHGEGDDHDDHAGQDEHAALDEHDGHEDHAGTAHAAECDDCGTERLPPATGGLDEIASRPCTHGIPAVECDGCRFEVGVVKVDGELRERLLDTALVEVGEGVDEVRLTGRVELAATRVVAVPAPVPGRIRELSTDLGRRVEAGDVLAVLHSGDLAEARAALLEAGTARDIAAMERERQEVVSGALAALLASLAARGGEGVAEAEAEGGGDAAADPPAGPVGEWRSKLVGAAARLRVARSRHRRELALEGKGIASGAEHEEAHGDLETAEAEYEALVEEVRFSMDLDLLKAANAERRAATALLAAEQKLRALGVEDGPPAAGGPGADFARMEIRAPRAGVVTEMDAAPGRFVEAGAPLFTVADAGELWVWCDLYERDLSRVAGPLSARTTLPVEVLVSAFPGRVFPGVIDHLRSAVDERTRTVKGRIVVANPDGLLRPGMFAEVGIAIPTGRVAASVPRSAVLSDGEERFVFQRWRDDLWVRRDVKVLAMRGDRAEVEGDLPDGAEVASGGAFMLKGSILREKMGAG